MLEGASAMTIYTGYIYLWYDSKAKLYYLGGHKGKVEDSYVCSNAMMRRAYAKRPETFRFKVLEYVFGDITALRQAEQRWLDKIKDEELYWTPNIYNKTVRYYNQKKISAGGNGTANKGKVRSLETLQKMSEAQKGRVPWNKGKKGVQPSTRKGTKSTYVYTDEVKAEMSRKKKEYWARKKGLVDSVSRPN